MVKNDDGAREENEIAGLFHQSSIKIKDLGGRKLTPSLKEECRLLIQSDDEGQVFICHRHFRQHKRK